MITDVVYDRDTDAVILVRYDDIWVLPNEWGLAHYGHGIEPVMVESDDGNCYLRRDALILKDIKPNGKGKGAK